MHAKDPLTIQVVQAIQEGNIEALKRLFAEHPGLPKTGIVDARGATFTLLHKVTDWPGHFPNGARTAALIAAGGGDVNLPVVLPDSNKRGETPLHWAASSDDVAVLEALLEAGADIEAPGACIAGGTALDNAVAFAQWRAAHRLIERGARTALWHSSALGLMDRIEAHFGGPRTPPLYPWGNSRGADLDEVTIAFWCACHGGQRGAAEYLLDRGAKLNWISDWDGLTPLDAAQRCKATELTEWLRRHGARSAKESIPAQLSWSKRLGGLLAAICGMHSILAADADPGWLRPGQPRAVPDAVFFQEIGRKVTTTFELTSLAVYEDQVYIGSAKGLYRLQGDALASVDQAPGPVLRLVPAKGALWAITGHGLSRLQGGLWQTMSKEKIVDVCEHLGEVIAASPRSLWRASSAGLEPMSTASCPFDMMRVASYCETLYASGQGRLTLYDGDRFGMRNVWKWEVDNVWDWGELPSTTIRDVLSFGDRLYLATDRGLGVLRGMSLTQIRGEQGLCYENTTCLAKGFGNDFWIGTSRGAIRHTAGKFHYFAGQRWLPNDQVNAIASRNHTVYIATDRGLGIIDYEPYTLLKKAAAYERHLVEWGQKRLGFVHKLEWDEKLKEYVREIGDNDGGYSCDYLAAQSYRYAVTKEDGARQEAANAFHAIRWLEAMTGIPGFPARSVWAKNERGHQAQHGSGEAAAEWHDTRDGLFEWKGDTSSDEICAHFYAMTLFLDLVAQGEEINQAKTFLSRVAGHLMDHGWTLTDLDGKPTRWGHWNPEYFSQAGEGSAASGLNGLQILSFLKTAETLTGEAKFSRGYQELVKLGYPEYTLRQKRTFPPGDVLQFLDHLAFLCYPNLLKYETDPRLRSIYRRSFERSWEIERIEQLPWFNFVYGAVTGNECEVEPAVNHLREWPLDLVIYSYQNSHRTDLRTPPGYVAYSGGIRPFSPREREPMLWDNWTMKADGGTGGNDVVQPSSWLLAYWMGRYHGFIEAPKVTDPDLLHVGRGRDPASGARPYEGPPRPEVR